MRNTREKQTRIKCFVFFISSFVGFLGLDQLTKWWALKVLQNQSIQIIPNVFDLTLRRNMGSAFGMRLLNPSSHFLVTLAITVVFALLISRFLPEWRWWFYFGAGLFLSGAWGNLIDRLRLGFVVDFFEPSFWATFNVADISIIAGLILIFINFWFQGSEIEKTEDPSV